MGEFFREDNDRVREIFGLMQDAHAWKLPKATTWAPSPGDRDAAIEAARLKTIDSIPTDKRLHLFASTIEMLARRGFSITLKAVLNNLHAVESGRSVGSIQKGEQLSEAVDPGRFHDEKMSIKAEQTKESLARVRAMVQGVTDKLRGI